jgi:hypothetical protein
MRDAIHQNALAAWTDLCERGGLELDGRDEGLGLRNVHLPSDTACTVARLAVIEPPIKSPAHRPGFSFLSKQVHSDVPSLLGMFLLDLLAPLRRGSLFAARTRPRFCSRLPMLRPRFRNIPNEPLKARLCVGQ